MVRDIKIIGKKDLNKQINTHMFMICHRKYTIVFRGLVFMAWVCLATSVVGVVLLLD